MHTFTEWAGEVVCFYWNGMANYRNAARRTARGHEHGTALTFLTPGEEELLSQLERRMGEAGGGQGSSSTANSPIKPYKFRMSEVEGF